MFTVKALSEDHKIWITGYVWEGSNSAYVIPHNLGVDFEKNRINAVAYPIDKTTICTKVGVDAYWYDKNGGHIIPIYENDILQFTIDGKNQVQGRVVKEFDKYIISILGVEDAFINFYDIKDKNTELLKARIIGNYYDALQRENKPVEATKDDGGTSDECPFFEARETDYDVLSGHSNYDHYCTKNYEKKIIKCIHCTLCKQKGENK